MTKYMTNKNFNNEAFAEMLNAHGVKAYAMEDGVALDRAAYNACKKATMPMWMYQNLKYVNNPYCTEEI